MSHSQHRLHIMVCDGQAVEWSSTLSNSIAPLICSHKCGLITLNKIKTLDRMKALVGVCKRLCHVV